MDSLTNFIESTQELIKLLESGSGSSNREEFIKKMDALLDKRQVILDQISDLSTLNDTVKAEMLQQEQKLKSKMMKVSTDIKKDLKILQLKKKNTTHYNNPYNNLSTDGMFYDKRK